MTTQEVIEYLSSQPLIKALWWFIENASNEHPWRNDAFIHLRERVRSQASPAADKRSNRDKRIKQSAQRILLSVMTMPIEAYGIIVGKLPQGQPLTVVYQSSPAPVRTTAQSLDDALRVCLTLVRSHGLDAWEQTTVESAAGEHRPYEIWGTAVSYVALHLWRKGDPRTIARLNRICTEVAQQFALDPVDTAILKADVLVRVRWWEMDHPEDASDAAACAKALRHLQ